jgi:preprotein translocase subunit SecG
MAVSLYIIQIILSIAIISLVLLQAKGGGLGSIFGGSGGVYRTKRGVEKTLYQATIGLSVAFFVISLMIVGFSNL